MSKGGVFREIALTKESVRGTAVAPASGDGIPHTGFSFKPNVKKADNKSAMGLINGKMRSRTVQQYADGEIPFNLIASKMGLISNLIMGQAPTNTGTGTVTHTWALANNNQHITYTVTVKDAAGDVKQYAGGMLNEFKLDAGVDDYVKISLGLMTQAAATGTWTPSYTASDPDFVPSQLSIKVADNVAGLTSATPINADTLSLSIKKNGTPKFKFGSNSPYDIKNGRIEIQGDMSLVMDDNAYRTLAEGDTNKAVQIIITDGTITWTFTLPSVDFGNWSDEPDTESSAVMQSISFYGNSGDLSNGFLKITLVDTVATY